MNKETFFINRVGDGYGFLLFGRRLKKALLNKGYKWDRLYPNVSFIFVKGLFRLFTTNILRLDGLYFDSENTLGNSDKLNRPIFKAYKKADGIIFQSEFDRQLYYQFMGNNQKPYRVISNGVPPEFNPLGEKVDYGFEKTLICSSSWRAHKRLDCIIRGFLEYGNPNVGLVVLGEGVREFKRHPNIKYLGKIAPEELPKYLRGGDAFIHLSWLDHCPNAVVEAIACGLPVLCSHNGGTKEIVRSNGIVIQCEEEYDFRKTAVYKPPKCDKAIVAKGIEQILCWNKPVETSYLCIENVADEYWQFYKRIRKQ